MTKYQIKKYKKVSSTVSFYLSKEYKSETFFLKEQFI